MPRKTQPDAHLRISDRLNVTSNTVKSARRVVDIFEYFDDRQAPASVMEISDELGYPQSSTSALLKSLASYGYLNYDPFKRTYILSSRTAFIGSWVSDQFFADGKIMAMMRKLSEQTANTIVLSSRNGVQMQYIHVLQATTPVHFHIVVGTARPLVLSGAGYALLSQLPDGDIRKILTRTNAEAGPDQPIVRSADLFDRLAAVRRQGYAITYDMYTQGGGIIAAPLPAQNADTAMAMGIAGFSEVLRGRETEFSGYLLDVIKAAYGDNRAAMPFPGRPAGQ